MSRSVALGLLGEKAFIMDANSVSSNIVTGEIFWRGAPIPFRTQPASDSKSIPSDRVSESVLVFEFVFGDPLRAAIFKKRGSKTNPPEEVGDHLVRDVLSKGSLDCTSLAETWRFCTRETDHHVAFCIEYSHSAL